MDLNEKRLKIFYLFKKKKTLRKMRYYWRKLTKISAYLRIGDVKCVYASRARPKKKEKCLDVQFENKKSQVTSESFEFV